MSDGDPRRVEQRDWVIDLVRVGSVFVVVLLHWLYVRVTLVDGQLQGEQALHGRFFWALSWLLQVMPAFFLAGGFTNTVVLDRLRARYGAGAVRHTAAEFVGLRARRLLTPLLPLVALTLVVSGLGRLTGNPVASNLGEIVANPLWFLAVYLLCVGATPLVVRAHDELGWWVAPSALLTGSLLVDWLRFAGRISTDDSLWPNLALVWLFCHQLGVLHARGTLRSWTRRRLLGLVAAAGLALAVMVGPGPWFPATVGMADAPITNLMPPTSALSVLAIGQLGVLTLVSRRFAGWQPSPEGQARLGRLTALLMVVYLWQVPAMTLATGVGLLAPDLLLPSDEGTWWVLRPLWFAIAGALLFLLVRVVTPWERLCHRLPARTASTPVLAGAALGTLGVAMLWQAGLLWTPRSLGAALLVLAGSALLTPFSRRSVEPGDSRAELASAS